MPHLYGKLISNLKEGSLDSSIKYLVILILLWIIIQGLKIKSSLF